jgi:hypothetical protein
MTYDGAPLIENAFDLSFRGTRNGLIGDWDTGQGGPSVQPGAYARTPGRGPFSWHKILLPDTIGKDQSSSVTINDNPPQVPGTPGDGYLIVWYGPADVTDASLAADVNLLSLIASNDDGAGNGKGLVSFDATPYLGRWVYIQHGAYSQGTNIKGSVQVAQPITAGLPGADGAGASDGSATLSGGRVYLSAEQPDGPTSFGTLSGLRHTTVDAYAGELDPRAAIYGYKNGRAASRLVPINGDKVYFPDLVVPGAGDGGDGGAPTVPTTGQIWPRGQRA